MWEQKKEDKPECVKVCGRFPAEELIHMDYYVLAKINFMMKKYQNLEWLAYLVGKDDVVNDFYIPQQKVTASNVTDIEGDPEINIIGVVHSHHHLGLHNFSGTDHAYINDNHNLSILVWHGGMNGQKRISLPCGSIMIAPIRIEFFHPEINTEELEKEADDNISEKTYTYIYPTYERGVYTVPRAIGSQTDVGSHAAVCNEKKNTNGKNAAKRLGGEYSDYLDHLVYDEELGGEMCAEDFPESERSDQDVEDHFDRIERNCGLTKHFIPKPPFVPARAGFNVSGNPNPTTGSLDANPLEVELLDALVNAGVPHSPPKGWEV